MKIWTLTENEALTETFFAEHGLSFYIETGDQHILFDMGQSGAFAENAEKMGLDLSKVDFAVLSHGHYDHGGGLKRFLEINKLAPVYVSRYAFGEYCNAAGKYIGLDQALRGNPRLIPVPDRFALTKGITLMSCNDRKPVVPVDSAGLQKMQNNRLVEENCLHEQYMIVEEKGKRICFSGCSHKGILNITQWIESDVYIGGFHFMKQDPHSDTVQKTAQILSQQSAGFYTCHCTGKPQYEAMKSVMGEKLHSLSAGEYLEIGEA